MAETDIFQEKLILMRLRLMAESLAYLAKANFNPNQQRIPAGYLGGGQWTNGGSYSSSERQLPRASSGVASGSSGSGRYEVAATCAEHIAASCKGSIMREFPSQYLGVEIDDVRRDAASGNAAARKALKLMFDKRFQK